MNAEEPVIDIEQVLPARRDEVWRAWTSADELRAWLAEEAMVHPEPGGAFELFWEPARPERNSTRGCRVLDAAERELLSFTWRGPVPFAELMNVEPLPTWVTVTLEDVEGGATRLRLRHRGWGSGPRWDAARLWQEQAWRLALERLRERLR